MRLTLDLPATIDELAAYVEACRLLGMGTVADDERDGATLMAVPLSPAATPTAPTRRSDPDPLPSKKGKRAPGGTIPVAILTTLADADGMFDGSYGELAKVANPSNPASAMPALRQMEKADLIAADRQGRNVKRTAITTKGRAALAKMTDGPTPEPTRRPAPATPAALRPVADLPNLKPPSGGWA